MKLSIIIPVYNAEPYLRRCLDAVLNQGIEDYEVILVNDGSKDGSQSIMDEYAAAHPDVFKYFTVENGGQGRARNIALDCARGEYVGFVDSDDYPGPDMFRKLILKAEEIGADTIVCNWYRFEGEKLTFESYRSSGNRLSAAGAVWNKIYRRSLIGDIRFPQGLWYEDFAFSAKLLIKSEKTAYIDDGLYFYRADNQSTMRNGNALKNLDMIAIMEDIRAAVPAGREEDFRYLLINNVLLDSVNRVALQKSPDKSKVIAQLLEYVHRYIPNLSKCDSYKAESRNRRLIMKLNYSGFYNLSKSILKIKSAI